MKNRDIFRKLRHKLFFESISVKTKTTILLQEPGCHKIEPYFFKFSQDVFGYFAHIIVLFCVKLTRKFIHWCKMQGGEEHF